ncbi:MAG: hypothetical protein QM757_26350 [Paludibaculum sp.]
MASRTIRLTPTDKAQNNISIICKKFYITTLLKEVSGNSTYNEVKLDSKEITTKHQKDSKEFGFVTPEKHRQLPYLMWTPKMHKIPTKQRFIAAQGLRLQGRFGCRTTG